MSSNPYTDNRKPTVIKRAVIDRKNDEERSIEISHMRLLMRRYRDKAREEISTWKMSEMVYTSG